MDSSILKLLVVSFGSIIILLVFLIRVLEDSISQLEPSSMLTARRFALDKSEKDEANSIFLFLTIPSVSNVKTYSVIIDS